MRTAHLLLFVSVLSLCCASGLGLDLEMIAIFFESVVAINDWINDTESAVRDPPTLTIADWIIGILFTLFVVAVAVLWIYALSAIYFIVSVIKLEVAFVPAEKEIWNHIQYIERANTERSDRRKEILMSELISSLQDNLESISTADCRVKYNWRIGKIVKNWKYIYAKEWAGMQQRKETIVKSEEVEHPTITLLIAAQGVYDVPTLSQAVDREEIGAALQKIGLMPSYNEIEACDVSYKQSGKLATN